MRREEDIGDRRGKEVKTQRVVPLVQEVNISYNIVTFFYPVMASCPCISVNFTLFNIKYS